MKKSELRQIIREEVNSMKYSTSHQINEGVEDELFETAMKFSSLFTAINNAQRYYGEAGFENPKVLNLVKDLKTLEKHLDKCKEMFDKIERKASKLEDY